jgi:hypothetical protein
VSVSVLETASRWFGATYPEDKLVVAERVRELIAAGEYPASLWG